MLRATTRLALFLCFALFLSVAFVSCGKKASTEETTTEENAADSTEHEHPADSSEHPSEHPEHPSDSTSQE